MRRTNLYLDPEKLRALKMIAISEDASVSDLVREAIDAIIEKRLTRSAIGSVDGSQMHRAATTLLADALRRIDMERSDAVPQDGIESDVADAIRQSRAERASARRIDEVQVEIERDVAAAVRETRAESAARRRRLAAAAAENK